MLQSIRPAPSALRGGLLLFTLISSVFSPLVAVAAEDPLARTTPVPADQPVPVTDYFRPWLFAQPAINPKGTHVAALVPMDELRTGLVFADLEKNKTQVISAMANKDIWDFDWISNERTLLTVVQDNLYASGMYVADTRGKSHVVEQWSACHLIGIPVKNSERPLIWVRRNAYDEGKDYGVMQIDTKRGLKVGRAATIADAAVDSQDSLATYGVQASVSKSYPQIKDGIVSSYFADRLGELAFAVSYTDGHATLHYLEGRKWVASPANLDEIYIIGAGDADLELIVMGPVREGRPRALHRFDARSGELGDIIYEDDKYDPEAVSIIRDRTSRRMIGLRVRSVSTRTVWFDETMRQVQRMVEQSLPRQVVLIVDMDEQARRMVIASYTDKQPPVFHLLDLEKKSLGLLKQSAPWIDPARSAPMHLIQFNARDGVKLEGFLTVPPAASNDHPVPLVVLPHGGPWAHDSWGWDPEAQFLASRGYAVFQPNYRGSTGYDWKFPHDIWDFAKMHDDVTDGVNAVRNMGLIDGNRVAIMGTSFGGYLALTGATQEPDLYRCAITNAGVFDWQEMVNDAHRSRFEDTRYQVLRRNLFAPENDGADLERISPLHRVAAIRIPVFVAHGKEDSVVSIRQSRQLVEQLEAHGATHEVFFARGEGHGMEELRNQAELYTRIEQFLAAHL